MAACRVSMEGSTITIPANIPLRWQSLLPACCETVRYQKNSARRSCGCRCKKPVTSFPHSQNSASDISALVYCVGARCILRAFPGSLGAENQGEHRVPYRHRHSKIDYGSVHQCGYISQHNAPLHRREYAAWCVLA